VPRPIKANRQIRLLFRALLRASTHLSANLPTFLPTISRAQQLHKPPAPPLPLEVASSRPKDQTLAGSACPVPLRILHRASNAVFAAWLLQRREDQDPIFDTPADMILLERNVRRMRKVRS
jgi:hypothetical protein